MKSLPLINIHNKGRKLYLFCRDKNNNLIIDTDETFLPYFYEPCDEGKFTSFDRKELKKIFTASPSDVPKRRSNNSYESDIIYTKRYLIDRIDKIERTNVKYSFIDTEILADRYPSPELAEYPFSVISSHNSYTGKITTFYLGNYTNEESMIEDFIKYLQKEQFDLLLFWNGDRFDMPYLLKRIDKFSEKISPIKQARYGTNGMLYPAGISIVDYMLIDKKITLNRKKEYSLEARAKEVLSKSRKVKDIDFSNLSPQLIERCENDIRDMIDMEKKLNYIPLLDSLRRLTKTEFEDYIWNSRYVDQLLLKHAKNKNVILPKKHSKEEMENVEGFEGAFREVYQKGRLFNCGSYDISGAYLNSIIELNLDPANIREEEEENTIPVKLTDRKTNELIKTYYIKQSDNSILPAVAKELLDSKNKYKELKNKTSPDDPNYKNIKELYDAYKSISLSTWGVIGNKYFRYYDSITSSLITSVPRDLLHYVKEKLEAKGFKIMFIDTDGIVVDDKGKNIADYLNRLVKNWSIDNFGKEINISFDYEGRYEKLFVKANCHYKGKLRTESGLETKTKGIESKRKDCNAYIEWFQNTLLDKIMDNCTKEEIVNFVKEQIVEIKNRPIQDISFIAKLAQPAEEYKTIIKRQGKTFKKRPPIFVRALQNTKNFDKKIGELFNWIYIIPKEELKIKTNIYLDNELKETLDYDISRKDFLKLVNEESYFGGEKIDSKRIKVLHKKDKPENVLAFDNKQNSHITQDIVDWSKIIDRNILYKVRPIFEAMDWNMEEVLDIPKKTSKSLQNKPISNKRKASKDMYPPKMKEKKDITQPAENKENKKEIKEVKPYYVE